jgi:transcriptional regulator with XRE-family HTH domain
LRREEVANLAGVSYSWYTRMEQGQDIHATAEVIDSIADALQLTYDEHRHHRGQTWADGKAQYLYHLSD